MRSDWTLSSGPVTRIIAGAAGGRSLRTPPGEGTRPTSDRVREALFSRLEHLEVLAGSQVLDLYAGSGALGLEALSRGAAQVVLVESNQRAAAVIAANIETVGRGLAAGRAQVRAEKVERLLRTAAIGRFDLVLIDPPYALTEPDLTEVLRALADGGWLASQALVIIERSGRSPEPTWPAALRGDGHKRYGDTTLWFAEADESAEADEAAEDQGQGPAVR